MNDTISRPMATYRLQFNRDFRFADARELVPSFSRLGLTHIYASPILRARQDSTLRRCRSQDDQPVPA